jgi:hypothetical protein
MLSEKRLLWWDQNCIHIVTNLLVGTSRNPQGIGSMAADYQTPRTTTGSSLLLIFHTGAVFLGI